MGSKATPSLAPLLKDPARFRELNGWSEVMELPSRKFSARRQTAEDYAILPSPVCPPRLHPDHTQNYTPLVLTHAGVVSCLLREERAEQLVNVGILEVGTRLQANQGLWLHKTRKHSQ